MRATASKIGLYNNNDLLFISANAPTIVGMSSIGTMQLRKGRFSEPNRIYHVITSTAMRRPVFACFWSGRVLVESMRAQCVAGHASTLAYVIMPDHLHWLVRLSHGRSLSVCVNAVKSGSAREINRRVGHSGQLWQKGFYDRAIRYHEDLVTVARYVVANPLRAGIVDSMRCYSLWDATWI